MEFSAGFLQCLNGRWINVSIVTSIDVEDNSWDSRPGFSIIAHTSHGDDVIRNFDNEDDAQSYLNASMILAGDGK